MEKYVFPSSVHGADLAGSRASRHCCRYVNPRVSEYDATNDIVPKQVLISIQSMILCEEPYLNEPGWAGSAGTPQSAACAYHLCLAIQGFDPLHRLRQCTSDGGQHGDVGKS